MRRSRILAIGFVAHLAGACATAKAVSRGYSIHTADLSCEDANRYVQEALGSMDMTITDFRKARVGTPGYTAAERKNNRGRLGGSVDIRCDEAGVHIVPDERGFSTTREFERGVFLSVIGRANLVVEREGRYSTGILHKRQQAQVEVEQPITDAGPGTAPAPARVETGVQVQVELVRGFATVLDFEANVAAAGILPVKISIVNGTSRAYDFDPAAVVLRTAGGDGAMSLGARKAVERLRERAGSEGGTELGDVEAAAGVIPEREIKADRLDPGERIEGYLYFSDGDYPRARVTMTDVATGEAEGFLVEF